MPAAIHLTPEAMDGGAIARVRDGDIIRVDGLNGSLQIKVDAAELMAREPAPLPGPSHGYGRELFGWMRGSVGAADHGASVLFA